MVYSCSCGMSLKWLFMSEPGCLAFCRGCSTETCSESKAPFPVPFSSEQLILCWLQSMRGLEGGGREAEWERASCQQETHT